jgi:hypothetical protein
LPTYAVITLARHSYSTQLNRMILAAQNTLFAALGFQAYLGPHFQTAAL